MTKVTITSDLHIDFWVKIGSPEYKQEKLMHELFDKLMPDESSDILIIAGDIGHYNQQNQLMYKVLRKYFKEIYWTYGNHDLYLVSKSMLKEFGDSRNRLTDMINLSHEIDGVRYLDGDVVTTHGINIGGVATWYDNTYANEKWNMDDTAIEALWYTGMNDSRNIFFDGTDCIDYLELAREANAKCEHVTYCDLVFSHIAPTYSNLLSKYNEPFSTFYHFDGREYLDTMLEGSKWIYGHTHDKYDYVESGVNLIANPLGYPPPGYFQLNPDISSHKFVTIDVGIGDDK